MSTIRLIIEQEVEREGSRYAALEIWSAILTVGLIFMGFGFDAVFWLMGRLAGM